MKELDATQVEQLKTIGAYLGRERKERGVSLDEIAVKTYIPLRLLQALEEGQVERLPEPVFVQGFIRRFADAIGLDGMALAKTFSPQSSFVVERKAPTLERPPVERQSTIEQPRIEQPAVEPLRVEPNATQPSAAQPDEVKNAALEPIHVPPKYIQRGTLSAKRSYLPWVLLGTAAALLLGVGLINVLNRPHSSTDAQESKLPVANPNSAAATPQPSTAVPTSAPSSQGSVSPSPTVGADTNASIQVAVNLTDESWFQVIADGKTAFEGTLKKGEQKTWIAQKTLVLEAGNAGAVSVSYNQGEAKLMGALGEVKDMTFTAAAKTGKPGAAN